jgi:hypothetical protein
MANVKKGHLTATGKWWDHLRWMKRSFWKSERQAGKAQGLSELREEVDAEKAPADPR